MISRKKIRKGGISVPKCNQCLGSDLIASAAAFEAAVASLLNTQATYMDTLIQRDESTNVLMKANEQACNMIYSVKQLEESIVNKVEDGMDIRATNGEGSDTSSGEIESACTHE